MNSSWDLTTNHFKSLCINSYHHALTNHLNHTNLLWVHHHTEAHAKVRALYFHESDVCFSSGSEDFQIRKTKQDFGTILGLGGRKFISPRSSA